MKPQTSSRQMGKCRQYHLITAVFLNNEDIYYVLPSVIVTALNAECEFSVPEGNAASKLALEFGPTYVSHCMLKLVFNRRPPFEIGLPLFQIG